MHIVRIALEEIRGRLTVDGAIIENKGATAAIHYRQAKDTRAAREAILTTIREAPLAQALRVFEGKMVVELRPSLHLHKGHALASLVWQYGLRSLIYLGDDSTDVDAFNEVCKLRNEGRIDGISVAVLGPETPVELVECADATLQGVPEVERFLQWLNQDDFGRGAIR